MAPIVFSKKCKKAFPGLDDLTCVFFTARTIFLNEWPPVQFLHSGLEFSFFSEACRSSVGVLS